MEKKGPLNEMKGRLFYVGTVFSSKALFGGLTTSGEPSGDEKGVSSHPRSSTNSILQQVKKKILDNSRCIVPNFMND